MTPAPQPSATASEPDAAERQARRQRHRFIYVVAGIAALGGALFGYDTGVISGALVFMDFGHGPLSPIEEGWIASSLLAGAGAGALFGGRIADRIGRRKVLLGAAAVFVIAAVGSAVAVDMVTMVLSRVVLGLSVGTASITVPLYIAEMVPAHLRGRLVTFNSLAIVTGQLIAYVVNSALAASANWRLMLGLAAVPAVGLFAGMIMLPDTPRWYAMHGQGPQAGRVLARIYRRPEAGEQLHQIERSARRSGSDEGSWRDFRQGWVLRVLLIAVGVAVLQQVTGANTVVYFAPSIMVQTGFGEAAAVYASIAIGVISVVATAIGLLIMDRFGRRQILLVGEIGGFVSLVALGVAIGFTGENGSVAWSLATLGLMVAFMAVQQSTVAPVCWLIISEIMPRRVRGLGMGLAGLALWLANCGVSLAFLPVLDAVGGRATFWGFAVLSVVGAVFVVTCVPETRGMSLEEVEAHARTHGGVAAVERAA